MVSKVTFACLDNALPDRRVANRREVFAHHPLPPLPLHLCKIFESSVHIPRV